MPWGFPGSVLGVPGGALGVSWTCPGGAWCLLGEAWCHFGPQEVQEPNKVPKSWFVGPPPPLSWRPTPTKNQHAGAPGCILVDKSVRCGCIFGALVADLFLAGLKLESPWESSRIPMGMLGRVSHFRGPFWLQFGRFWRLVGVLGSCTHFLSIKVSGMGVCWGFLF